MSRFETERFCNTVALTRSQPGFFNGDIVWIIFNSASHISGKGSYGWERYKSTRRLISIWMLSSSVSSSSGNHLLSKKSHVSVSLLVNIPSSFSSVGVVVFWLRLVILRIRSHGLSAVLQYAEKSSFFSSNCVLVLIA